MVCASPGYDIVSIHPPGQGAAAGAAALMGSSVVDRAAASPSAPPCFHAASRDVPLQGALAFAALPMPLLTLLSPAFVTTFVRPEDPEGAFVVTVWEGNSSVSTSEYRRRGFVGSTLYWETWWTVIPSPASALISTETGFLAVTQEGVWIFNGWNTRMGKCKGVCCPRLKC